MKNNLADQIIQLVSEQIRSEQFKQVALEDNFQDLGLDSLDHVELVIKLEDLFGKEISDDVAINFFKVGDIVNYFNLARMDSTSSPRAGL